MLTVAWCLLTAVTLWSQASEPSLAAIQDQRIASNEQRLSLVREEVSAIQANMDSAAHLMWLLIAAVIASYVRNEQSNRSKSNSISELNRHLRDISVACKDGPACPFDPTAFRGLRTADVTGRGSAP